jgi:hypothetical protein
MRITVFTESVPLTMVFSWIILLLLYYISQYCAGDKIEKNEIGGACSTYGGEERCVQGFGGET